jgi:hypothetical protein
MKLMTLTVFVLTTIILFSSIVAVASLSEEEKKSIEEILKRILTNPEFLALDGPKQLNVLIAIYNIVERNEIMFL